ncbi:conserved exported hypothetical protein [Desulfamplus magnetovallimortis]|uniref:Cytochrome c domain-containing protein n=1 Tax=Desulfamplus magnetovallimortis TaxID=1246637 RepID=A0A1W1HIA5_9BACT|nr:GEGP motif-containing diheme protein [Desulfamplus magnetovallimortis]SLM32145.1 conserved exported hypothetical protein [Desulfamplus magnetovallimortis]
MSKRTTIMAIVFSMVLFLSVSSGYAAYHHEGERDSENFLAAYPDKAGTKLDHCALCHSGGSYEKSTGSTVSLGSCQWCHYKTEYGRENSNIEQTINAYGNAYKDNGRNESAISRIDELDSDDDGSTNQEEITAGSFPGNASDNPFLTMAPSKIYTRSDLEALQQHTQFLLMNTSRSGDFYAQYTGVPLKDLLDDAGILTEQATGITVFAPDGWSQYHPLNYEEGAELYHVYGNMPGESYQYPPAVYNHVTDADYALNPDTGWCDYSAPSVAGRSHGDPIYVENGLKAILAMTRDGAPLDTGVLTDENKLDGSGPYRVVVPQKVPSPPDQSSKSDDQDVEWPYNYDWDHNAGAATRSVTIIRVEPLPEGTTDIDILEAGWSYIDNQQLIIYGAINPDAGSSDKECITLAGDFGFTLPHLDLNGMKFGIHFKYSGTMLDFEADMTTLSQHDDAASAIVFNDDLSITVPCIDFAGNQFAITMKSTSDDFTMWSIIP